MEEKLVGRGEGGGGEGDKKVELVEWERWTVLHPASELTEIRACKARKQVPLVSVILSQQRFCLKFLQNRFRKCISWTQLEKPKFTINQNCFEKQEHGNM